MFKDDLSRNDRARVSNVIELCAIAGKFDENITYKLIDLILLEPLHDFDDLGFSKLTLKFLYKNINEVDFVNLGSVIYVLLLKNPKLKKSTIVKVVSKYIKKSKEFDNNNSLLNGLNNKFFDMFKSNSDIRKLKAK